MILAERARDVFEGVLPSPYPLFRQRVRPLWRDRVGCLAEADGGATVQTVDPDAEPLLGQLLAEFQERTGLPLVVNSGLNTDGRPIVDTADDAVALLGSTPATLLAIAAFTAWR
jgi:carbamoyltransferase